MKSLARLKPEIGSVIGNSRPTEVEILEEYWRSQLRQAEENCAVTVAACNKILGQ
jgi:hypothetical protein